MTTTELRDRAIDQAKVGGDSVAAVALAILVLADEIGDGADELGDKLDSALTFVADAIESRS